MSFELESHASDYGKVYQQGRGHQYNISRAYFEPQGAQSALLFNVIPGSLVRESDPLELGVHRAAMLNGNAIPAYVPRDVDDELTQKLTLLSQRGGLLIIVGDSTAGKSRAAYQALLRTVPDYRLVSPYDRNELRESFASIAVMPDRVALWLDNIERYLGNDGLTPRIASYLKHRGVICIGTIRTKEYRGLTDLAATGSTIDAQRHEEVASLEHVLEQAEIVSMKRRWSPTETARAKEIDDQRVAEALNYRATYGIAEYLAAGPKLYEEWSLASAVDANPRGAALVSAAIDCQRAGMLDSVPLEVLRSTHEHYLEAAGGQLLGPENFDDALDWATKRRYGVTSLLLPGKQPQSYRAFDYLIDMTMTSEGMSPVPGVIWETARSFFSADDRQLDKIARAATLQKNLDVAVSILTELTTNGSATAASNLASLFARQDDKDQAEHWYKKAIELGSARAAIRLGHLLQYDFSDRVAEAEHWYEHAAQKGEPHGMYHMGLICKNKGMVQEAENWFRQAVEREEFVASSNLGEILVSSGRLEEAKTLLRTASDKGNLSAMVDLGIVLDDLGQPEEAEQLWLKAATGGSGAAKANLARRYARQKRYSEAEGLYREARAKGVVEVDGPLSLLLARRNKWREAEEWADKAYKRGDAKVAWLLGDRFYGAWRMAKAEEWLKKAADAGESRALGLLAAVLEQTGRQEEAESYWHQLAAAGEKGAVFALAKIRLASNDVDEATKLFLQAAEEEQSQLAACELGRIYWHKGDLVAAEEWLKKSQVEGHVHAACLLGFFYKGQGKVEAAEEYWKLAYKGGHTHAASDLATLLAVQGRGKEAATWLSRSRRSQRGTRGGRGPSRNRSKRRR